MYGRKPEGPLLPQVFVSHGARDDPIANRLATRLRQELRDRAIDVIDGDQLPCGRDFIGFFEKEAARSKVRRNLWCICERSRIVRIK